MTMILYFDDDLVYDLEFIDSLDKETQVHLRFK